MSWIEVQRIQEIVTEMLGYHREICECECERARITLEGTRIRYEDGELTMGMTYTAHPWRSWTQTRRIVASRKELASFVRLHDCVSWSEVLPLLVWDCSLTENYMPQLVVTNIERYLRVGICPRYHIFVDDKYSRRLAALLIVKGKL